MSARERAGAKALFIDTGPLYALSVASDQYHQRARREMDRVQQEGWEVLILQPIVMETYSLLLRRVHVPAAHAWLARIAERAVLIAPTVDDHELAMNRVQEYPDQRLSLFDVQLAVLGERFGLPVWTYDADFDALGAAVWR